MTSISAPAYSLEAGDKQALNLLTFSHLVNDMNQSVLPALIPWLMVHRGLNLATAATLVLAMNLSSSIVQPLFGHLSDKRSLAWVIPVAVFLACAGMAVVGVSPGLPLMFLGALISGIGVAAFHPEGSRFSNYFAGAKRAQGMSLFTLGGYLGFALGPVVITPLILTFGLHGTLFMLVPGALIAYLVTRQLPRFEEVRAHAHRAHREHAGADDWRAFAMLIGVVVLRSMTFLAAVTFTSVFAITVSHANPFLASATLAVLLFSGAAGTLYGGRLADRIDRRRVVTVSMLFTCIFGAALAFAGFHHAALAIVAVLALCFGFSLGLSAGVIVVLGQEYLPHRIGVASGVTLGLAVTLGGLAAPLFGMLGDRDGIPTIFVAIAAFALLSFIGSFFLPQVRKARQVAKAAA